MSNKAKNLKQANNLGTITENEEIALESNKKPVQDVPNLNLLIHWSDSRWSLITLRH